jgi:hypothetical protein
MQHGELWDRGKPQFTGLFSRLDCKLVDLEVTGSIPVARPRFFRPRLSPGASGDCRRAPGVGRAHQPGGGTSGRNAPAAAPTQKPKRITRIPVTTRQIIARLPLPVPAPRRVPPHPLAPSCMDEPLAGILPARTNNDDGPGSASRLRRFQARQRPARAHCAQRAAANSEIGRLSRRFQAYAYDGESEIGKSSLNIAPS